MAAEGAEPGSVEVKMEEGQAVETAGSGPRKPRRASIIVQSSVSDATHRELDKKKVILREQEDKGRLEARTVADAVTGGGKSSNVLAVDQLGLDILAGFRRKVFGLLILQSMAIWGLAGAIARIPIIADRNILKYDKDPVEYHMDIVYVAVAWIIAIMSLCVVARYRYHWHQSVITLTIFTILIANALALMCGKNVIYGMGLATLGMILVAIPAGIRFKDCMIEILPVSMVVAVFMLIIGFGGWLAFASHIQAKWAAPTLLLNALGMAWLGYEMDWICSRLNPDEYLLPIFLVWSEIATTIIVVAVMVMASDTGACETDGCLSSSVIYCQCDCWIYSNGDSSRKQYYRNLNKFGAQEGNCPPAQQTMQQEH